MAILSSREEIKGRGLSLILVTSILMLIAIIVVIMRLIVRFFVSHISGMDDWCALAATIIAIGMVISMDLGVRYGTGKVVPSNILDLEKCKPVGSPWIPEYANQVSCISVLVFWCDVAIIFLISNIWIVSLPFKPILGLHLAFKKRVAILGLLCSTGLLCVSPSSPTCVWINIDSLNRTCTAAAIRLAFVVHLYKGHDPSRDIVPIYLCSIVEISSALMASSIPALRQGLPRFRWYLEWFKKRLTKTQGSDSTSI